MMRMIKTTGNAVPLYRFIGSLVIALTAFASCSGGSSNDSATGGLTVRMNDSLIESGATATLPDTKKRYTATVSFFIENQTGQEIVMDGTTAITLSGTDAGLFALSSRPANRIAPGSFSSFAITFTPVAEGNNNATCAIAYLGGTFAFNLTGNCIANTITEDRNIYANDTNDVLELHFLLPTATADTDFNIINHWKCDDHGGYPDCLPFSPPPVPITFQEVAPGIGTVLFSQTGSVRLRGASTRDASQKSFKVELDSKTNLWRGQSNLNFNKHYYELVRVRNKLSFDLFKTIANFTSLRIQFVHIKVKKTTDASPVSFGLFTFIENANKDFLSSHGLDRNGHLYKARDFTFSAHYGDSNDDLAYLQRASQLGDMNAFELRLETKGNSDHNKLYAMLEEVNDQAMDIDEVIDRNFNRDNYITWLAVNILLLNTDTITQNFYLYSPSNAPVWYFMPWDYDGAWGWYFQPDEFSVYRYSNNRIYGPAHFWAIGLHQRFFQKAQNVADLHAKIIELKDTIFTTQNISSHINDYKSVMRSFLVNPPDSLRLPVSFDYGGTIDANVENQIDMEFNRLINFPSDTYAVYDNLRHAPLPVWVDTGTNGTDVTFAWDSSYNLDQSATLTYDFQLATTPFIPELVGSTFSSGTPGLITFQNGITGTSYTIANFAASPGDGIYYWRIIIRNSGSFWQVPFDTYVDSSSGTVIYGGQKSFQFSGGTLTQR